jgi:hypothetical protein
MKNLKQLIYFILSNTDVKTPPPEINQILQLIHLPPLKILNQLNSIQSNYFDRNIRMLQTIYNQQKKDQFRLEGLNKIITDTPKLKIVEPYEKKIQILVITLQAEKKETNKRLKNFETQIEKIKKLNQDFTEKLKVNRNEAPPVAPINLLDTIINTVSTYKHDKSGLTSESKEIIGPINATPVFKPSNTLDIPLIDTVPSPTNSPPSSPKMSAADFDKFKTDPPVIPMPRIPPGARPTKIISPDIASSNQVIDDMNRKLVGIQQQIQNDLDRLKKNLDGSGGDNCTIM